MSPRAEKPLRRGRGAKGGAGRGHRGRGLHLTRKRGRGAQRRRGRGRPAGHRLAPLTAALEDCYQSFGPPAPPFPAQDPMAHSRSSKGALLKAPIRALDPSPPADSRWRDAEKKGPPACARRRTNGAAVWVNGGRRRDNGTRGTDSAGRDLKCCAAGGSESEPDSRDASSAGVEDGLDGSNEVGATRDGSHGCKTRSGRVYRASRDGQEPSCEFPARRKRGRPRRAAPAANETACSRPKPWGAAGRDPAENGAPAMAIGVEEYAGEGEEGEEGRNSITSAAASDTHDDRAAALARGGRQEGGEGGAGVVGHSDLDGRREGSPPGHRLYCRREQLLIELEGRGEIAPCYVHNDGEPEHLVKLVNIKNCISNQLPAMPRPYITRVVMNRNHRCVALMQPNGAVVAAACYRPFHVQKFGELVFFAVEGMNQVQGFGTRLMNHLKENARDRDGLTHILTYADNKATGFFAKNGFSKKISLPREVYQGYIKDYEHASPMECVIHPNISHTSLPETILRQRKFIMAKLREYSNYHKRRPGLHLWRTTKHRNIPIQDIPGIKTARGRKGALLHPYRILLNDRAVEPTLENLERLMRLTLQELRKRKNEVWPFVQPVSVADVPDYYTIITDPIDLRTIEERLVSGSYYITLEIFLADLRRMWHNCRTYNSDNTFYYKCAEKLDKFVSKFVGARVVRAG
eukprot:evm.model.scf_529.6 EVM.evm.TU.scf_529.6   scf_529:70579-77369(-)